jgi:hypothetical protein
VDNLDTQGPNKFLAAGYAFFNKELFADTLPDCVITLRSKRGARGYFWPERFAPRIEEVPVAHELAMCPEHFDRTEEEILSTLVHEMTHVWQQTFGKPGRGAYHNAEWGKKMIEVGLHPSDTGAPGGKMTGTKVSHYIMTGGAFEAACARFLADAPPLGWHVFDIPKVKATRNKTKTAYACPYCKLKLWGRDDLNIICGECGAAYEKV